MKKTNLYIGGFLLLLVFGTLYYFSNKQFVRPNIVIVLTDDQGYGDVGFNGNQMIHTPILDSLALQSLVIDRFYVSPLGISTRGSLLSGKYQSQYSAQHSDKLAAQSLVHLFNGANYKTAYFGKWNLGASLDKSPSNYGFDTFLGSYGNSLSNYFDTELISNETLVKTKGYITDVLTDSVIAYISNQQAPYLAIVAFNTPHIPYQVPEQYLTRYKSLGLDERTACIYGMVENIDDNVKRIVHALKQNALFDQTIFVYLSDNGPNYLRYNAGLKGRKAQVDEGGVRVPFILSYPNGLAKPRKIVNHWAAHIDLMPTLLELAQITYDKKALNGVSLVSPALRNAPWPKRNFFTYSDTYQPKRIEGALRSDSLLLTLTMDDTCLYNLKNDRYQREDMADLNRGVADSLVRTFEIWRQNNAVIFTPERGEMADSELILNMTERGEGE